MANTKSAKKRAIQAEARRERNVSLRSKLRTFIKKVRFALEAGDKNLAQTNFKTTVPVIDKMASKGIIRKTTAARYKSRLNARVKKLIQSA